MTSKYLDISTIRNFKKFQFFQILQILQTLPICRQKTCHSAHSWYPNLKFYLHTWKIIKKKKKFFLWRFSEGWFFVAATSFGVLSSRQLSAIRWKKFSTIPFISPLLTLLSPSRSKILKKFNTILCKRKHSLEELFCQLPIWLKDHEEYFCFILLVHQEANWSKF